MRERLTGGLRGIHGARSLYRPLVLLVVVAMSLLVLPGALALTKSIPGDTSIGTWDPVTRTYTLTTDWMGSIGVIEDNLTLDGDGHFIGGRVNLRMRTGVTVRKITIDECWYGIRLIGCTGCTIADNTILHFAQAVNLEESSGNIVANNTIKWSTCFTGGGIGLLNAHDNLVTNNTVLSIFGGASSGGIRTAKGSTGNVFEYNTVKSTWTGIRLTGSPGNLAHNNTLYGNHVGIQLGSNNTATNNMISYNHWGVMIYYSSWYCQVYNNIFLPPKPGPGATHIKIFGSNYRGHVFNLSKPVGGNYWSGWTSPDADGDGFVDIPKGLGGGVVDWLPWAVPGGWLNKAPTVDAGEDAQIYRAEQSYTVIHGTATDPDGDELEYRWLEADTMLLGWSAVGLGGEAYLDLATLPVLSLGDHTLTLEAREEGEGGLSATDEMVLTVLNTPPKALLVDGPYEGGEGSPMLFDATPSHDPDGTITMYEWNWDGGVFDEETDIPLVEHTWLDDWTGQVALRVTDDLGATDTASVAVTILNLPPSVTFGVTTPYETVFVDSTHDT